MGAITLRNLPEPVHDALRQMAEASNMSVEGLVRNLLTKAVTPTGSPEPKATTMSMQFGAATGMAEAQLPWIGAPAPSEPPAPTELWGALRGFVHIPADTDLTAPTGAAPADTALTDTEWDAAR